MTLSTIAEQTKIRLPLLEALEQDDVSHWPGGIFRRSYLRTYARAIGLNPEDTLREFLELHPDPDEGSAGIEALSGHDDPASRPRTRLQYLINSAIGALPQMFHASPKDTDAAVTETAVVVAPLETVVRPTPQAPAASRAPDAPQASANLAGIAALCTQVAQAGAPEDVAPLIAEAAQLLRASGLLLWVWDAKRDVLWPSFSHGYTADVLAQIPQVHRDSDNAIAAAFRSGETRIVDGGPSLTGAVVVPVKTPGGCAAVLALELAAGRERDPNLHALAVIFAAQLSMLCEPPSAASATAQAEPHVPASRTATA